MTVLIILTPLVFFFVHSYAQDSSITEEPSPSQNIKVELDKIDFKQKKLENTIHLLKNYFICTSLVTNNIKACDNLSDDMQKQCIDTYNLYTGLWELAKSNNANQTLNNIIYSKNAGNENLNNFINKDLNACKTNNCKAFIKLDESLAGDTNTKNQIIFMKAIENQDSKVCDNIIEGDARVNLIKICKAMVERSPVICQSCSGVSEFKSLVERLMNEGRSSLYNRLINEGRSNEEE